MREEHKKYFYLLHSCHTIFNANIIGKVKTDKFSLELNARLWIFTVEQIWTIIIIFIL